MKDFFGLKMGAIPADFLDKWKSYVESFWSVNIYAVLIAAATVVIILLWPKLTHKIPGSLIAILVTTKAMQMLHLPIDTIGSRFGSIPSSLPMPA
jgi:SulP family sulfate permease